MWINDFKKEFQGKFSTGESILAQHSHDESHHTPVFPDVVFFPENEEDVKNLLKFANEYKIPVTGYGVGSSIEGNPIPIKKGIKTPLKKPIEKPIIKNAINILTPIFGFLLKK